MILVVAYNDNWRSHKDYWIFETGLEAALEWIRENNDYDVISIVSPLSVSPEADYVREAESAARWGKQED